MLSDAEDGTETGVGAGAGFSKAAGLAKLKGSDVKGGSFAFSNSAEWSGPAVYRAVSPLRNHTIIIYKLTSLANENPTGSAKSCGTVSAFTVSPITSSPSSSYTAENFDVDGRCRGEGRCICFRELIVRPTRREEPPSNEELVVGANKSGPVGTGSGGGGGTSLTTGDSSIGFELAGRSAS